MHNAKPMQYTKETQNIKQVALINLIPEITWRLTNIEYCSSVMPVWGNLGRAMK
jgi:hypothetical protein